MATLQHAIDWARDAWWALPAYVLVGVARPLVLFPATVLTLAAGLLFGPVIGLGAAVLAANGSALLAYSVGRLLGPSGLSTAKAASVGSSDNDGGTIASWRSRLRDNSFEAVLLMRLLFLPYDAVNYGAGFLRVRWRPFLGATALGSLPGTFAFVLAGSSLERLDGANLRIDPVALAASVIVLTASLVLARVLRHRRSLAAGATTH
ncbi:MAG: TVP38/TMEM64 family protein [Acidimicrobiia bacterium]